MKNEKEYNLIYTNATDEIIKAKKKVIKNLIKVEMYFTINLGKTKTKNIFKHLLSLPLFCSTTKFLAQISIF